MESSISTEFDDLAGPHPLVDDPLSGKGLVSLDIGCLCWVANTNSLSSGDIPSMTDFSSSSVAPQQRSQELHETEPLFVR
jgi:hypothetical protein